MSEPLLVADRYEVVRTLGSGAFGRTLLARDRTAGRLVALKVLHPSAAANWKAFELFEREAAVLRDLRHPGVPAVHETLRAPWQGADAAFLVMEYIEGTSLAEVIAARRHLDTPAVLDLVLETLGLLEYLHSRVPPILHRDIKPANLILREGGSPALVDFGAVRNVFRSEEEAGSTIVGTHGYMPYEQYMAQASPSSDLYALAATVLHLVTGRPPADFMTGAGRLEVPPDLPVDQRLRGVLARMLAPAPADRFPSAREVRTALLGGPSPQLPVLAAQGSAGSLAATVPDLGPVPRALTGAVKQRFDQVRYTAWDLMDDSKKPGGGVDPVGLLLVGFFSLITIGILPGVVLSTARARKQRLKRFFRDGLQATARVVDVVGEADVGFGIKLKKVRYEFEVDGRLVRDTDQLLAAVAERWLPGDTIQILYLPGADNDSVIISTG